MKDSQSIGHSKWNCKYQIAWIPKYREKRLFGELRKALGPVPRDLAAHRESEIIEGRFCGDDEWLRAWWTLGHKAGEMHFPPSLSAGSCQSGKSHIQNVGFVLS